MSVIEVTQKKSADEIINEPHFYYVFWKNVFRQANEIKASDIHVEPVKSGIEVRARTNGKMVLLDKFERPEISQTMIDKLKYICGLDLAKKTILQDDSMRLDMFSSTYRISLSPGHMYGENIVLRIIRDEELPSLDMLRMDKGVIDDIKNAVHQKQGLFLITGPTGSGKSTTLQAAIMTIDRVGNKVISIENPPEREIPGVRHEKITDEFTWKDAIKGAMRQDPDVILIGEIRDRESAELAIEASQTGHLVLSTLHTNDVPTTVERLMMLGVERHHIADSAIFISAQRLVNVLCEACKKKGKRYYERNHEGCEICKNKGYIGRRAILEYCAKPDPELIYKYDKQAFRESLNQTLGTELEKLIEQGIVDERMSGVYK